MEGIRLERAGGVAVITVDRPDARNAIDRASMSALESILDELESDEALAAVILTGASGIFISGGDLKDFTLIPEPQEGRSMSRWMQGIVNQLASLPCPTIAALDGDAIGGGCELALACDLRVATVSAHLRFKQVAMGLTPGWGGGQRLARLVGRSRAILLFSTAATVAAMEARDLGLVDRVVEGSALSEALHIAEQIARSSVAAVRNTKRAIDRGLEMPLWAGLELEAELFGQTWGSEPHRAAVAAFLRRSRGGTGG